MTPRTALIALIVGVLSVPAIVLAATTVLAPADGEAPAEVVEIAAPISDTAEVLAAPAPTPAPPTTTATTTPPGATKADLKAACGRDGRKLVKREAKGTITELEQAALDALRPICEEAGRALDGPPVPEPVVIVDTVVTGPSAGAASAGPAPTTPPPADDDQADHSDDDWDDDEYEDDDEHEDEDEDHDEDDEDEEDEDDEDDEDDD